MMKQEALTAMMKGGNISVEDNPFIGGAPAGPEAENQEASDEEGTSAPVKKRKCGAGQALITSYVNRGMSDKEKRAADSSYLRFVPGTRFKP